MLNQAGEVVAVLSFGLGTEDARGVGGVVGVWGHWNPLIEPKKEEPKEEQP